jgi:cell division protein FtsB
MNKAQPSKSFWQSAQQFLFKPSDAVMEIGDRRQAELIAWISLLLAGWFLLAAVSIFALGRQSISTLILVSVAGVCGAAYSLSRTHRYAIAGWLLVIIFSAAGYAILLAAPSIEGRATLLAIISLSFVIASAVLPVRGMALVVIANSALCFALPAMVPELNQISYLSTACSAAIIGILLAVFSNLRNSVENERLEKLRAANQQLHAMQENLEQLVNERTAAAESARLMAETSRLAAESARNGLENQVWLATGQTRLADATRGELDISQMAGNVVSHLCQYMGAQAGALFLLREETLKLEGSYAFAERPGFDGKIQFGEGLVGQAARDGIAVFLEDIPSDALIISTGLMDVKPRQIIAAPFYANGEVVGVVELVTLAAFTQFHFDLLDRVSEGIGVAFRTAQTRQRLAELLMASQQQAEELQAQEEELRAANEELQAQSENLKAVRELRARK